LSEFSPESFPTRVFLFPDGKEVQWTTTAAATERPVLPPPPPVEVDVALSLLVLVAAARFPSLPPNFVSQALPTPLLVRAPHLLVPGAATRSPSPLRLDLGSEVLFWPPPPLVPGAAAVLVQAPAYAVRCSALVLDSLGACECCAAVLWCSFLLLNAAPG
jgi:hypothetical protein